MHLIYFFVNTGRLLIVSHKAKDSIKLHIGLEMLCYDTNLAITWIFKEMSQISDIKPVQSCTFKYSSIIQGTAQTLLSPSRYPAGNDDL